MKKLLISSLMFLCLAGCKKIKENIQEKKVLDFITSGQWAVTKYQKGSIADYASDYTGYSFKFNSTETVDAIKNATIQKSGTWHPDATIYTITAAFPNDAVYPLPLLNGVWQLVDGGDNYAVATQTIGGELYT